MAVAMLFLGAVACESVKPNELQGTWLLRDSSRQMLPSELRKAQAKISLNSDGTFSASDMPGLFFVPNIHATRLESGNGVWKLVSREGEQQIQLDFQKIADWKETELPYGTQLDVSKEWWSAVEIFYFLGDADEGQRISFEKQ